jgi:hypothetical protein
MNEKEWWEEEAESIAANRGYGLREFCLKLEAKTIRLERERIRELIEEQLKKTIPIDSKDFAHGEREGYYWIINELSNE